jgi:hypothetical protein
MLLQSGKNNKLCSVKKFPEVLYKRFKRIFQKGLDIGFFFQRCLRRFTRGAFKAPKLRIRNQRKKTAKTLARFFKPELDKMNKHAVQ